MRFLADENVHRGTVDALRAQGYDVESIAALAPSADDVDVLALANMQGRTLITYDTDFGELVFLRSLPAESGVMLLRLSGSVDTHTARLIEILSIREDWNRYFTTVSDQQVRRRRLPRPK